MSDEDIAATLEGLDFEIQEKSVAIVHVIKNMDVSAIDEEVKRLQNLKRIIVNRQQRLKDYLRESMVGCGISKIEAPTMTITLRKPLPIVVVDDADALPEKFNKVTVAPNKVLIKATLKAGEVVPGAHLEDGKPGIMIK